MTLGSATTSPQSRPSTPASQLYDVQQGVLVLPGGAGEPSQVTYDLSANSPANSIFSHDDPDPAMSSANSVQPVAKAPNLNSSSVGPDFAARSEADSGAGKAGQVSRSATVSYLDLAGPPQDLSLIHI